ESPPEAPAAPNEEAEVDAATKRESKTKSPSSSAPEQRDEAAAPRSAVSAPSTPWGNLGLSVGSQALLFVSHANGTGMMGPNIGVYAVLPGFVAHLSGEYDFTFGEGDQLSVRVANGSALALFGLDSRRTFEIGGGFFAGGVFAEGFGWLQPRTQSEWFWGATARARYAVEAGGWRLAFGPDFRFYGYRPQIAIDGAEAWGLPVFAAGISLDLFRELYGPR
ncbi:MAG: hypothetical protein ABW133_08050, partial [Polyangiaceae bacterium]